jgi:pyridoxine/pyridoxamine 5'-phosphate oxidase
LATANLKIVEVKDIGGVGSEDWTELDLADKKLESIDGQVRQKSFHYNPSSASKDTIKTVCTWMVRAASPSIADKDATAMAASVVDHQTKMIAGNTVLTSYDDHGCEVYYTGL